jgi:hypothetical protein
MTAGIDDGDGDGDTEILGFGDSRRQHGLGAPGGQALARREWHREKASKKLLD